MFISSDSKLNLGLVLWLKWGELKYDPTGVNWLDALELLAKWTAGERDEKERENFWHIPTEYGPDICATCFANFGPTHGGRVRAGCFQCQDTRGDLAYAVQHLASKLGISEHEVELAFSFALLNYWNMTVNAPKPEEFKPLI